MTVSFNWKARDPTRIEAGGADNDIDLVLVTITVDKSDRCDLPHLLCKYFDIILSECF